MPSAHTHTPQPPLGREPRPWWEQLGLRRAGTRSATANERHVERAALAVLAQHPPTAFESGTDGAPLTLEAVAASAQQAAQRALQAQDAAAAERARLGWARVEEALTGPGATEIVSSGRWAGFARGDATAWLWSLFDFEPHGFVMPGAQLRVEALRQLEAGGLPEVFGYPERARELAGTGMTPREYRRHREALGAKTFSAADVRHG